MQILRRLRWLIELTTLLLVLDTTLRITLRGALSDVWDSYGLICLSLCATFGFNWIFADSAVRQFWALYLVAFSLLGLALRDTVML